ncbi:MAG: hypothetical protein HUU35_12815, partial [Armatimonadetes bacterium]|nr:hypothetical protein [Armatimonadota bacterium]
NNIDYSRPSRQAPDAYHHCERVANVCAGAAWKAWNTLWESDFQDDVPLAAALELVELTPYRPTATQLAEARAYLAAHQPEENLMAWAYAREHLLMEHGPQRLELPLQALRLGETGLIGLPGEVFAEIGLEIKARSPFAQTVTVGLANDSVGYVAPDHQLEWGGYECTLCRHVVAPKGTAQNWTATAVRLLEQVAGAPVAAQG